MKAWAITSTNIKRLVREPSTIFFVFVFPMLLILVLGASFGGGYAPKVGVVLEDGGEYAQAFEDAVSANEEFELVDYDERDSLIGDVESGIVQLGVILPEGYGSALASGEIAGVEYVGRVDQSSVQYRASIEAVIADQSAVFRAARLVSDEGLSDFESAVSTAQLVAASGAGADVIVSTTGDALFGDLGQFDLGAPSMLVLFVFLTSFAGSAALIQTRRWGVSRRMVSTPTSIGEILVGESGGRFAIAMIQGLFIMVGAAVAFEVRWGNLVAAAALLVLMALIGAGAGMAIGATFDNDEQASSVGIFASLGMAALGGCMVPLEIFPKTMQTIAHITPHAWGIDGFAELVRRGGDITSIGTELAVLAAFAVVVMALGTWRLRVSLTR